MKSPLLALSLLLTLACGCAVTSIKKTWKAPEAQSPVGKIAALVVADRSGLRQGFENRFVLELAPQPTSKAFSTFGLLTLPQIKADKRAAADRFLAAGADTVLVVRLFNVTTSYREIQPGGERYVPVVAGISSYGWYDYYDVAFMDMSPTYGSLKEEVMVESCLFDLRSGKRLWSALSKTVLKDTVDRVAESDILVAKIVAAMKKDGMLH